MKTEITTPTKQAWTPKPWEIRRGRSGYGQVGVDAITSIGPIAADHNHFDGSCLSVSEEDAKLIAKAPTMAEYILRKAKEGDADAIAIAAEL